MKNQKFTTLVITLLALCCFSGSINAQNEYVEQVIVASGGIFEPGPTNNSPATMGTYDPFDATYQVFDTIDVESVQGVEVNGNTAFVAAQDTIVKYDLQSYERIGSVTVNGIGHIDLIGDMLFVSKFSYTGQPLLEVFDQQNLNSEIQVSAITEGAGGASVINDTAYVAHNIQEKNGFNDSTGRLAVLDLNNQQFKKNIELGPQAAGIKQLYSYQGLLYGICNETGQLLEYDPSTGNKQYYDLQVSNGTALYNGTLYANFYEKGIGAYNLNQNSLNDTAIVEGSFIASTFDSINNGFYASETDFSTYGRGFRYLQNGTIADSFSTGISPEGIAVDYAQNQKPMAVNDQDSTEFETTIEISVLANDSDPDQDSFSITAINQQPNHGNALIKGHQYISYTPSASFTDGGWDTLTYEICDYNQASLCNTAEVAIYVEPKPQGPNQYLNEVIVASGGIFEPDSTNNSPATMGTYDPFDATYQVFDTIDVESTQGVEVDYNYAYAALEDSVIKYDLQTYERVNAVAISGIKQIELIGDQLFVSKFNFAGNPLTEVFSKQTLNSEIKVNAISESAGGAVTINDTAYIAHNIGKQNAFNDSLGKLAVIDLNTRQFVRNIDLGMNGAGINQLYAYGSNVYGVCDDSGQLLEYNPSTNNHQFTDLNVSGGTALEEGILYANYHNTGIGAYNIDEDAFIDTALVEGNFAALAFDRRNEHFFATNTDFSTFGAGLRYNYNGQLLDSFSTAISPEGIAISYRSNNNSAPIANKDTDSTEFGMAVTVDALSNDEDPDQDSIFIKTIISLPANGNAELQGNKNIQYTPDSSFIDGGWDTLSYELCDHTQGPLCDTTQVVIYVESKGTNIESHAQPNLTIYPNPVTKELTIESGKVFSGRTEIKIKDLTGKTIHQTKRNLQDDLHLQLPQMESGVYMLQMKNEQFQATYKILKQ